MSPEVQLAVIGLITTLVTGLIIPVVLAYLKGRRVENATAQEAFLREAATDAASYAEEVARSSVPMTGADKLVVATERMKEVVDQHASITTPPTADLEKRIQAQISTAIPGHAGTATSAVMAVPQDPGTTASALALVPDDPAATPTEK